LTNKIADTYLAKRLLERFVGISSERSLPRFAPTPFPRWFRRHPRPAVALREAVLFSDTLSNYSYPEIAIAATEVLEATGCAVQLAGISDSGRPAFSKGMVPLAQRTALRALDRLHPLAQAGLPIVFLEPSDWSMFVDDYAALLDDPRVATVAAQCVTFEQYIMDLADAGELTLRFPTESREILLHGHCHQKALGGTAATVRALSLPGYRVREVDTSCCGMAGSFGYEAEHGAVSRAMAERRLLGAVRSAPADTIVVAPGVSCRQQIGHGSGRKAQHPAQVLREAMIGERDS
jgi:Fe-S oxidoreductase